LKPNERGILPSRSSIQKHNYQLECGADNTYINSEETSDGTIFRISVGCILKEFLSNNQQIIDRFGRSPTQFEEGIDPPPVIRLAGTIDGGALTCHKGFIIYGIKFVQKEFVNVILGKDIDHGDGDTAEGNQSVRLI
jgi:hypothetical protein